MFRWESGGRGFRVSHVVSGFIATTDWAAEASASGPGWPSRDASVKEFCFTSDSTVKDTDVSNSSQDNSLLKSVSCNRDSSVVESCSFLGSGTNKTWLWSWQKMMPHLGHLLSSLTWSSLWRLRLWLVTKDRSHMLHGKEGSGACLGNSSCSVETFSLTSQLTWFSWSRLCFKSSEA